MVDFSTNEDDNGKYHLWYASPIITNPAVPTYLPSLGLAFEATAFDNKELTDPVPDGWGFSDNPEKTCSITILPGEVNSITVLPAEHDDGSGCENEYFDFYVTGYDCGSLNDYGTNAIWASIFGGDDLPYPDSANIVGTLLNNLGAPLGVKDAKMVYDSHEQKYRLRFVTTGCALGYREREY